MASLTAERAARIRPAPLHSFAAGTVRATIYARAADVDPALWAETFGDQPKDLAYYQLLERTMTTGYLYRYLVLSLPNDTPFALQPLLILDQDLAISLGRWLKLLLRALRGLHSRLLRCRMLVAGCLVGNGHVGVTKNCNRQKAAAALPEALFRYADEEEISLLTIKDFPAKRRREMQSLLDAGFTQLDGFPSLKLELDFASFEQYLSDRVSKITRKSLRRKWRRAAAAVPPLTLEVRSDCRAVIDEIYPLYLAVAERSEIQFEILTREYFVEAGLTMPERCRFFIWRQGGRAVAFSYCTVWGTTIFDHDMGLDYSVAHELNLYYVSFRDIIEWALQHRYRTYRSAPFNYDPKMHLGLELEPVDLFVRHRSPICNFLLRHFAARFSPVQSDPVLRRHFSATP